MMAGQLLWYHYNDPYQWTTKKNPKLNTLLKYIAEIRKLVYHRSTKIIDVKIVPMKYINDTKCFTYDILFSASKHYDMAHYKKTLIGWIQLRIPCNYRLKRRNLGWVNAGDNCWRWNGDNATPNLLSNLLIIQFVGTAVFIQTCTTRCWEIPNNPNLK